MKLKKAYEFKSEVWRWPGDMGWYFVTLDKGLSQDIRTVYKRGFVKIVGSVGKTTWNTSLFPHKESDAYLLAIKKSVREKEGIREGEIIRISFSFAI